MAPAEVAVAEPSSHELQEGHQPAVQGAGLCRPQVRPHAIAQQVLRLQQVACTPSIPA